MTEEEQKGLNSLIPLLMNYRDDLAFLDDFKVKAEAVFGPSWRNVLPPLVEQNQTGDVNLIISNYKRMQNYENAVLAWNEANALLSSSNPNLAVINERLPAIEYWLSIFGDAGNALTARLKSLLPAEASNNSATLTPAQLPEDVIWNFNHFMRLKDYYDASIERTSARCVRLGIEMSEYKHFSYILDLIEEIVELGKIIDTNAMYASLIEEKFPGGCGGFNQTFADFVKELDANATPEMKDEEMSSDKIKAKLGELATDEEEGDIGPAPDGFEPIPDLGDYEPATDITTTAEMIKKQRLEKENTVSTAYDVVNNGNNGVNTGLTGSSPNY